MAAVLASPRFLFRLEAPATQALTARYAEVDEYSLAGAAVLFPLVDHAGCGADEPRGPR